MAFVVSHNINDLEGIADEIIFINEGKIVNIINMNEIKTKNRYEICFFEEKDVAYAKQILTDKISSFDKNKIIIELDEETKITSIIKSLVNLSIKEIKEVHESLTELYLKYLGENANEK